MTTQGTARRVVIHYSATYPDQQVNAAVIDRWHRDRGFAHIGYHWVVLRDGTIEAGRPEGTVGAHVRGHNTGSIGICWAGGLDRATGPNKGVWNPTPAQEAALVRLVREVLARHPGAEVVGHIDLVATQCPGLPKGGVAEWWAGQQRAPVPDAYALSALGVPEPPGRLANFIAAMLRLLRRKQ